jgi:hypothetical protein
MVEKARIITRIIPQSIHHKTSVGLSKNRRFLIPGRDDRNFLIPDRDDRNFLIPGRAG